MIKKRKPMAVNWELVPDPDYRERLRQAFAIILVGENGHARDAIFDENSALGQYEGVARKRPGQKPRRSPNAT
jgi:hypothetical protein